MTNQETAINCAEACVNGCVLGENCPNLKYAAAASKFLNETSMDRILEISEERLRKKFGLPPDHEFPAVD